MVNKFNGRQINEQTNDDKRNGKWIYIAPFCRLTFDVLWYIQITQFYLQITSYLPLPRKRSPDGTTTD